MKFTGLALLGSLLSAPLALGAELSWSDAETGREFLMLDGLKTHDQTTSECFARGYAVYDRRNLTPGEQTAFLASEDLLDSLTWETLHAGTTRESKLASIWESSLGGTIASNGFSWGASAILLQRRGDRPVNVADEVGNTDETLKHGVCVAVDGFWYRCSLEYKCTYQHSAGEYSIRYKFAEYGNTENEAVRRIVAKTQEPRWAVSEGQCAIKTETQHCLRYLP